MFRTELGSLLRLPFREQRRSPLEVFQEAMRFPTAALDAAGTPPVSRDPAQETALPGDHHDLAPASSQALGEEDRLQDGARRQSLRGATHHRLGGAAEYTGWSHRPTVVAVNRGVRMEALDASGRCRLHLSGPGDRGIAGRRPLRREQRADRLERAHVDDRR